MKNFSRKFIQHPIKKFHEMQSRHGFLYYKGDLNLSWEDLVCQLSENKLDYNKLRGNFSFVWIPSDEKEKVIGAVDHLATTPLFYSKEFISPSFDEIEKVTEQLSADENFMWECKFMKGFNISQRTSWREIKRIKPCHFLELGDQEKQVKFIFLEHIIESKSDEPLSEFSTILENIIKKNVAEKNVLLLSGGTDSSALAAIVKKLNLVEKFDFLSLQSKNSHYTEERLINLLCQKLELNPNYYDCDLSEEKQSKLSLIPEFYKPWTDFHYLWKYQAIKHFDFTNHAIWTGEVGDQLFGGAKLIAQLRLFSQKKHWTARDVAAHFINLSVNSWESISEPGNTIKLILEYHPEAKLIYDELVNAIATCFEEIKTQDILNRFQLLNLIFKGPYRIYLSSQDSMAYHHPFSKWEVVQWALTQPGNVKVYNGGRLKEIFYQCWKDFLIEDIWEAPKVGTETPSFREFHI